MANFPQEVLDDIVRGQEIYVELNKEYIASLKSGCTDCDLPKDYACLQSYLSNLINLSVIGVYNDDAQELYYQMMLIIGGEIYVPPMSDNTIYTGTGTPTTEEEILAGLLTNYTIGEDMVVAFDNDEYLINFLAIPVNAPIPTQYQNLDSPLDTGPIGSPSDLFGAFTVIGDFRVAVTNYPIPLTGSYLFS